jgi:uncharacterized protein (UPF0332 family)
MTETVAIVERYLAKAKRALEEAHLLLQEKKSEGACSRAYYAMHDAAHAALFASGQETQATIIKTHHTLIAEFGKKIVLAGLLDVSLGRALNRVQDIRLLADYEAEQPSLDDAQWAVEQAEIFLAAVRNFTTKGANSA